MTPESTDEDAAAVDAELLRLERALAERDHAAVPGGLASLLDDAFVEFGSSGRRWDRDSTIASLFPLTVPGPIQIREFATRALADDVVLATYEAAVPRDGGRRLSRRSSIWLRRDGGWQLAFHQGTPEPPLGGPDPTAS